MTAGVALAAVSLPAGAARAPESLGDVAAGQAEATSSAFPLELQSAERTLQDPRLAELSGLAASRRHPGVLYGINDSANAASVFAIDSSGATAAVLSLPDAPDRDWEALAPGWDTSGDPVLWIGDIGDNRSNQRSVRLVRITEPEVLADQDVAWESFTIAYPDGPHNAEALVVHPVTGRLWVITKGMDGPAGVYQVPADLRTASTNVMERIMDAPSGVTDGAWELSPAGEPRLVLTDYWRMHRLQGTTWVSALGPLQLQREALAWPWLPDGPAASEVLLGSEGAGSTIVSAGLP